MLSIIKSVYNNWRRRILSRIVKRKVNLFDISVISMNCIGGVLYHDCNEQFLSPTINLYLKPSDFIKFINNLDFYLALTPEIIMGDSFPIGTIADIKIYFMHYSTPEEALKKWEERKHRINKEKIFVIMVERDGFTDKDFADFKKIRYPKLLFTKSKKYQTGDSLYLSKFKHEAQLPDIIEGRYMYSKMRLVESINCAYNKTRGNN